MTHIRKKWISESGRSTQSQDQDPAMHIYGQRHQYCSYHAGSKQHAKVRTVFKSRGTTPSNAKTTTPVVIYRIPHKTSRKSIRLFISSALVNCICRCRFLRRAWKSSAHLSSGHTAPPTPPPGWCHVARKPTHTDK